MYYEQIVRGQIAVERIERIAAASVKGSARPPRAASGHRLPATGHDPVARPRATAWPELR